MSSSNTPLRVVAAVVGLSLVLIQAALAGEQQPVRFNPVDQAAAKHATLTLADMGAGWKGGPKEPELAAGPCFMKRSDLVLTGAAKTVFEAYEVKVRIDTSILKSPAMVALEWQRKVGNPVYLACTSKDYMQRSNAKIISVKKLPLPKLTRYAVRYRIVGDHGPAGQTHRLITDMILLGQGRTQISLLILTTYANRAVIDAAEVRMAKRLVSRISK